MARKGLNYIPLCESKVKGILLPSQVVGLGAPQTVKVRPLPSPDRHNKSVHAVCSCGHSLGNSAWRTFNPNIGRLHVFNFRTAILACVVNNVFIIFFSQISEDAQVSFFENSFLRFLFQLYHGDQIIPWWRICIWRSPSVQHVHI